MNSNGKHEEMNDINKEAAIEETAEQELEQQNTEESPDEVKATDDGSNTEAFSEEQKLAKEDEELEGSEEVQEKIEEGLGLLAEKKRKWIPYVFEEPLPHLVPFDLHPVNDVVVRNAVNDGVKNKRDLSLYKTTAEWNDYPPGTVIIASLIEPGQPFAIWDPPRRKKKSSKKDQEATNEDDTQENQEEVSEQSEEN